MAENLRDKSRAETRAKLVTAASAEFARHGVQGARIQAIAKAAGVAVGTFYVHFSDKDALFEDVMKAGRNTVLAGLKATQEMEGSQEEKDRAAMEGVVSFAESYGALFRLLLARGGSDDPLERGVVDEITKLRAKELKAGQKAGIFRPDLNPALAARCEVGAVFHLLDWWLSDPKKASREEIISTLMTFRRYGVEGNDEHLG